MRRRADRQRFRPKLPVVNLLSPEVFEAMAVRRLRRRFLLAGCVLALLVAAGWGIQHLRISQAEKILTIEQAETSRLALQTQALAPVRAFVAAVAQQKATLSRTMAHEALLSRVLDDLRVATPSGVEVESSVVSLQPPVDASTAPVDGASVPSTAPAPTTGQTYQTAPTATMTGSPCPGPDPFQTRSVAGCVTLAGSATDRHGVGHFVIRLAKTDMFVEPFITTTTTADGDRVMFTGSVAVTKQVFSHRYGDVDTLISKGGAR